GVDLSSVRLDRAILRKASLTGARLRYLKGANLRGARLGGADLSSGELGGADLRSAFLSGANFGSADVRGALFAGADLRDARFGSAKGDQADFTRARMDHADLRSGQFFDAVFHDTALIGADLSYTHLRGATFTGADVTDMATDGVEDADLSGSTSKMPVGWVVVLFLLGLAVAAVAVRVVLRTLRRGRAARRSAAESRARFETSRLKAEEEATSLGEEIDLMDQEGAEAEAADWHEALDAYDAAKAALAAAKDETDLRAVRDIVHRGRDALTRPRKRAGGERPKP
ncbi:pentapeptide repeat-containing protein, partial [Streptomyces anulatus]|uniref:pentapeptide repeat-containing protein n=1 Tax=Streptomyces anulatus TaxID=1892 RepID=UPI0034351959